MKFFAVVAALLSVGLATEEVKPLTYTLPAAYPGYAAYHPYAAGFAYPGYAGAGYTFAAAPVAAKAVEVEAAPVATIAAATPVTYAAPVAAAVAPVTYAAAATPVTYAAPAVAAAAVAHPYAYAPYAQGSQFHAQDEYGNLNYGYANINSAKQEVGNTYGGVSGGYSYVDAEGVLQQVNYVADAAGFRVADSRLPVAPVYDGVAPTFNPEPLVAPVFDGVAPAPVVDTPEVAEAKAAHLAAVEAAKADRKKRDAEADPAIISGYSTVLSAPTPLIHNAPVFRAAYTHALPYTTYGHGFGYGLNRFFY